jgi:surface antigen
MPSKSLEFTKITEKRRNLPRRYLAAFVIGLALFGANESKARADTGGYPWAGAEEVNLSNFDWGYKECQSAMSVAGTCDSDNRIKPSTGVLYHESDPWKYDVRNCTSYVAWRINKEFGINIPGWGDGSSWDTAAHNAGYKVSGLDAEKKVPEAGDIAQWESNHVAFVTSINPDGSVNVAEYNHDEHGNFDTRGENPSQSGKMYYEKVSTPSHYIDINGVGKAWDGSAGDMVGATSGGIVSYNNVAEGQEFYTPDGWIYTKAGGSAWPIKNQGWTPDDDIKWGGHPVGPVPSSEEHDHEVGYDANGRNIGAHPPKAGTDVFVDGGNGQQYYFVGDKAFEIGPGEIDDLNVRDKSLRIPALGNRLADFMQNRYIDLPNGTVYRFAGDNRVNQAIYHPDSSRDAYWVNNDTVYSCLGLVQHQPTNILPQSSRPYVENAFGMFEIDTPSTCSFPPGMVLRGPGGQEQWRIMGDNGSLPYVRHLFPNPLLTYLHTSGNPNQETLRSVGAINNIPQGVNMAPPEGQFFRDASSGQVFESKNGTYHPIPSPDTLNCLGNPSIINVPGEAMIGMPQSEPINCSLEKKIVIRPDGRTYYISASKLYSIANPAIRDCISVRSATGSPINTSDATVNSYTNSGIAAHCTYEDEPGLNFVRENHDPTVWLVRPDGTKQHVGSLCVADAYITTLKKYHVFTVPAGETAGHRQTSDWFANPTDCNNLPG